MPSHVLKGRITVNEYLGLPTTQCTFEHLRKMRTGRCFRETTRADGRCYYHTEEKLAARKPRKITKKAMKNLLVLILEAAEECEDPAAWAKETAKRIRALGIKKSNES